MGLNDDLTRAVTGIFRSQWTKRDGIVVPDDNSVSLGNDAVRIDAAVLYADMDGSTNLVDTQTPEYAAELYKAFLLCAAKIVRSEGGTITAYDGDRIMAVFLGKTKNTQAVRCALKIHYAVRHIINPARLLQYGNSTPAPVALKHTVGIDTSSLLVAKTGARGANDLVWVGRAANYAAKLSSISSDYPTYITKTVHDAVLAEVKVSSDGRNMWEAREWAFNKSRIYRSNWTWAVK